MDANCVLLGGAPYRPRHRLPGPGVSGYTWIMDVVGLEFVSDTHAIITAIVVSSPQVPEDEGTITAFQVIDNGDGASGEPDQLGSDFFGPGYEEIVGGNFKVSAP